MSMSDLAVHHGNPASLIAEWRKRAEKLEPSFRDDFVPFDAGELHGRAVEARRVADELEAILVGFALVPADDPALDRKSEQSLSHYVVHGRYLTVTESMGLEPEGDLAETSRGPVHVIDESGRPYGYGG